MSSQFESIPDIFSRSNVHASAANRLDFKVKISTNTLSKKQKSSENARHAFKQSPHIRAPSQRFRRIPRSIIVEPDFGESALLPLSNPRQNHLKELHRIARDPMRR